MHGVHWTEQLEGLCLSSGGFTAPAPPAPPAPPAAPPRAVIAAAAKPAPPPIMAAAAAVPTATATPAATPNWVPYAKLLQQDLAVSQFPNLTGSGIGIAIIDRGIHYNAPQIGANKILANYNFRDANRITPDQH